MAPRAYWKGYLRLSLVTCTGKVVDKEHKSRGYELSKGRYVEIDDNELQAIDPLRTYSSLHVSRSSVPARICTEFRMIECRTSNSIAVSGTDAATS
jgi:non-homologous end joining protein Ku